MKKTTIASFAAASLSFILFIVSIIFISWKRDADYPTSSAMISCILSGVVFLTAFVLLAIFFDKKLKPLMLAPFIAILAISIIFFRELGQIVVLNNTLLDVISPATANPSVLAFLLVIVFIVALIFALWKNYKWAAATAIIYIGVLLVIAFTGFANITFEENNKVLIFSSLSFIFALAAMLIYLLASFIENNEIVFVKKEKPQPQVEETNNEEASSKTEEVKEENNEEVETEENTSSKEEKSEPEANENNNEETSSEDEKESDEDNKEESNNDPFKNQYSSSSSIFDVQDDAEKE